MARHRKVGREQESPGSRSEVQNAAKTLYANIRFLSPDKPIKSIAITSSVPNEGKSTIALSLAQAIATSGQTVLVVDTDMRRRSLAHYMRLKPSVGSYAVLTGLAKLSDAVVSTPIPNLFFLDTEPNIPSPTDVLSSKSFAKLVEVLESNFEYVIFDTPPVGTFVDAAIIGTLVDGVIFVVRPKHTKRKEMAFAYDQLGKADVHILGACANYRESVASESYYAYYSADGKRVKDRPAADAASQL
ncbi:MAG TPA: capsular biosynthesis protein [Coriobacteriia bacterium]|nr:capsular biosynthesis protein [Coriobacteriia bacterium]